MQYVGLAGRRRWPPLELAIGVGVIVGLVGFVFGWDLDRPWEDPSPPRAAVGGAPGLPGSPASPTASAASPTAAPVPTAIPTAVSGSYDADGDGFMTATELGMAVAATIPDVTFPPGYAVSADLIMAPIYANADTRTGRFESTMEMTILGGYHRCAWERAWLDARESGDEALAAEALAVMTEVVPYNVNNSPDTVAHMIEVARRAAAGDPSFVVRDVELNCAGVRFLDPAATPGA